MPISLPDPIAHIYAGFPIHPENITLEPEDPSSAAEGEVKIRVLDGFLFEKGGRFVYPRADHPDEWWEGVNAFGYTAAVTGDFKYFIWAGQWEEPYDGKHIEVVVLGNLKGLAKEANVHWRNGLQEILWLDTALGYSYALMEPSEEYDRGSWGTVTSSWINIPDARRPSDPKFVKVHRHDPRPVWWDRPGDQAWEVFVGPRQPGSSAADSGHLPGDSALGKGNTQPPSAIPVDSGSSDEEDPEITFLGFKAASTSTRPTRKRGFPNEESVGKTEASNTLSDGKRAAAAPQAIVNPSGKERPRALKARRQATGQESANKLNPKAGAMSKPRFDPNSRANLKRQLNRRPAPRPLQKQKTTEAIYVSSSDEETCVSSSPPPPASSPIAINHMARSVTLGRDDENGFQSCAQIDSATQLRGEVREARDDSQSTHAELQSATTL